MFGFVVRQFSLELTICGFSWFSDGFVGFAYLSFDFTFRLLGLGWLVLCFL